MFYLSFTVKFTCPVFSNGLKEIAGYFGYTWTDASATGVQAIVWRQKWADGTGLVQKKNLIGYNTEDCEALQLVTEKLLEMQKNNIKKTDSDNTEVIDITNMKREHLYETGGRGSLDREQEFISGKLLGFMPQPVSAELC